MRETMAAWQPLVQRKHLLDHPPTHPSDRLTLTLSRSCSSGGSRASSCSSSPSPSSPTTAEAPPPSAVVAANAALDADALDAPSSMAECARRRRFHSMSSIKAWCCICAVVGCVVVLCVKQCADAARRRKQLPSRRAPPPIAQELIPTTSPLSLRRLTRTPVSDGAVFAGEAPSSLRTRGTGSLPALSHDDLVVHR